MKPKRKPKIVREAEQFADGVHSFLQAMDRIQQSIGNFLPAPPKATVLTMRKQLVVEPKPKRKKSMGP